VCFSASPTQAEGRATDDVDTFSRVEDWWRTVDDAFLQIDDDQKRLTRETSGCTRRVAEFYGHVWGNDFVAWLQITRAFALLFLYVGFLKILVVSRTYVLATKGRWLSSAVRGFPRDHSNRVRRSRLVHRLGDAHKSARRRAVVSRPRNL
jgi:Flp pilus assembly protein TadB